MNDRQLLEAAAKAAGIKLECIADGVEPIFWIRRPGPHNRRDGDGECWSPLTDDGDALRLAVKLEIQAGYTKFSGEGVALWNRGDHQAREYGPDDPYAATRRAIVRAAAAMAGEKA